MGWLHDHLTRHGRVELLGDRIDVAIAAGLSSLGSSMGSFESIQLVGVAAGLPN